MSADPWDAADTAVLPDEGRLPSFRRATTWIGTEPLSSAALQGRVVLVDFWTYTCVNWLRTLPYLRAWDAKYRDAGLTIVGVHTPEFGFEHDLDNVAARTRELGVAYPVAVDSDYGIWDDFANHYWPALYLADAQGRIRYHHFGEEEYARTEAVIQQLLTDAGAHDVPTGLVEVDPQGLQVGADWTTLQSPETYLGYGQSSGFVAEDAALYDRAHTYPERRLSERNTWNLAGEWTLSQDASAVGPAGGSVSFAFHARDVNLVMGARVPGSAVPFRVLLDGREIDGEQGVDVDQNGRGTVTRSDTYQLVRQHGRISDRIVELEFPEGGVEVFCFTFG